jgi:hypothetical protein
MSAQFTGEERRRTSRFELALPVVLDTGNGTLLAESRNISTGGVFLQSPAPLSLGVSVQVTFSVPRQDVFRKDVGFHCEGTVVRLESKDDGFGIAIACRGISAAETAS